MTRKRAKTRTRQQRKAVMLRIAKGLRAARLRVQRARWEPVTWSPLRWVVFDECASLDEATLERLAASFHPNAK